MEKPEFISSLHSDLTIRCGKNLQRLLDQNNWTLQEITDLLGADIRTTERWIYGYATPDVYQIEKLTQILECTREDILEL